MYRPKVYTASKIHLAPRWQALRALPEWSHVEFTARWPYMAHLEHPLAPPPSPAEFAQFWTIDIQDVRRSDFVLLYGAGGDSEALRGALVEAGAGLALGKTILTVGLETKENTTHSWSHHPLVVQLPHLPAAAEYLHRYAVNPKRDADHG